MNSQTQCILKLNSLWTCKKNAAHTGDVLIVRGCVRDGPRIDCRNSVGYRLYLPLLTLRHNASLSHNIFNCVSVALYLSALSALFSLLILALFFRSLFQSLSPCNILLPWSLLVTVSVSSILFLVYLTFYLFLSVALTFLFLSLCTLPLHEYLFIPLYQLIPLILSVFFSSIYYFYQNIPTTLIISWNSPHVSLSPFSSLYVPLFLSLSLIFPSIYLSIYRSIATSLFRFFLSFSLPSTLYHFVCIYSCLPFISLISYT